MNPSSLGAIFDWDGVVIDSAVHHEQSWEKLAKLENRPLFPGHFERGFGMKNEKIIPEILKWTTEPQEIQRLSLRKEELYRESLKETGIKPLAGVETWLKILSSANIPCVVASSTARANIDLSLSLIGLKAFFSDIVSADDVKLGKPNPDVFLTAAKKIQREPSRCIVFEDALVGIEAARNAKMKVVAVATTNPASKLTHADRVVSRLDELTLNDLQTLVKQNDLA
jgi:beta-phosphoglucomutase family hydrolase